MPTLNDQNKHYANDVKLDPACWSPTGFFNKEFLTTTTGNIQPGHIIIRGTGAGGENTATEAGNDSEKAYGIAGLDQKQIEDCDATYASGDKIPVYPFHSNLGCIFRNIRLVDPNAAVPADTKLCCEASGEVGVAIEATLIDEDGNGITSAFNDAGGPTVAGTNGANGATIHNRIAMVNQYYIADPGADTTIIARVQPW